MAQPELRDKLERMDPLEALVQQDQLVPQVEQVFVALPVPLVLRVMVGLLAAQVLQDHQAVQVHLDLRVCQVPQVCQDL